MELRPSYWGTLAGSPNPPAKDSAGRSPATSTRHGRCLSVMVLLAASLVAPSLAHARREPPPAVIPTAETEQAEQLFKSGRYADAVTQAKVALTKNERYTPAMLVMAKSFYKLHKYEWMKKLWEMMQANGASNPEKAEIYQLLAFLEVDQKNVAGSHRPFQTSDRSQAGRRRPLEQPRSAVPGRQELQRGDPGAGEGCQPSTGIRQGSSELG